MLLDQSLPQTNIWRIMLAIVAAAILGATVSTTNYLIALYSALGAEHFHQYGFSKGTSIFFLTFLVWLTGLVLLGGPVWAVMHAKGLRNWKHAVLAGTVVPFFTLLLLKTRFLTGQAGGGWSYFGHGGQQWLEGRITTFGFQKVLENALYYAVIGALLALLIWFIAYKRPVSISPDQP